LVCYGEGNNILPCIHLDDLVNITVEVIEVQPEQKYILAVDEGKSSLYEITKAIADGLSNGIVKKKSKEDAFIDKTISQSDYDMLTVNLRLDPVYIKEAEIELKYENGIVENIAQLVQEYKDARGLWPIKVVVHGPPASGRTTLAQKIAEQYKIHYLEPEEVAAQVIADLEARVAKGNLAAEDEETDFESDKDYLTEIRETLKSNNGKLTPIQITGFVREKIRSMACRNQGYVLDGSPANMEEANELFRRNLFFNKRKMMMRKKIE
jgi:adenylate kinase